jgi:hypothetical protein
MYGELGFIGAIVELLPQRFLCSTIIGNGTQRNDK